ncbi:hypothetical protein [Streptomyces camelliae]|uniref:hypothetical protein n=1 Tax=Streptomyces camelliae TaxID=3004093 RepID=UPI002FD87680
MAQATRVEHDLVGDKEVPADAYSGVHTPCGPWRTSRSGAPIARFPDLITSLAAVKQAAAQANRGLGLLPPVLARAIISTYRESRAGRLRKQFVVDPVQGGPGTSTDRKTPTRSPPTGHWRSSATPAAATK